MLPRTKLSVQLSDQSQPAVIAWKHRDKLYIPSPQQEKNIYSWLMGYFERLVLICKFLSIKNLEYLGFRDKKCFFRPNIGKKYDKLKYFFISELGKNLIHSPLQQFWKLIVPWVQDISLETGKEIIGHSVLSSKDCPHMRAQGN